MLGRLPAEADISFAPHQHLVHEGEQPSSILRIVQGWAARYCLLPDGRRQIAGLYLPGDYCEPQWIFGRPSHQPVVALTKMRASLLVLPVDNVHMRQLFNALNEQIERQSDWMVAIGRKSSVERVAHMLYDVFMRLRRVGLSDDDSCEFHMTQLDVADLAGLTAVHVNRTLKALRSEKLIELRAKQLRIFCLDALRRLARIGDVNAKMS